MRKQLMTSLILILVPTLLFTPVYVYLICYSLANTHDYAAEIQGSWIATQYYYGKERFPCNEDNYISIIFEGNVIAVAGNVLPDVKTDYSWTDGSTLKYYVADESYTYLLSLDENNLLKVIVDDTPYIIFLRRSEG